MLLFLLGILWIFGGIYCTIVDWLELVDLHKKDLLMIIIIGMIIGPFIGLINCIEKASELLFGESNNRILIKRKHT